VIKSERGGFPGHVVHNDALPDGYCIGRNLNTEICKTGSSIRRSINILGDLRGSLLKVEPRRLRGIVTGETEIGIPVTAGADAKWVVKGQVATV